MIANLLNISTNASNLLIKMFVISHDLIKTDSQNALSGDTSVDRMLDNYADTYLITLHRPHRPNLLTLTMALSLSIMCNHKDNDIGLVHSPKAFSRGNTDAYFDNRRSRSL